MTKEALPSDSYLVEDATAERLFSIAIDAMHLFGAGIRTEAALRAALCVWCSSPESWKCSATVDEQPLTVSCALDTQQEAAVKRAADLAVLCVLSVPPDVPGSAGTIVARLSTRHVALFSSVIATDGVDQGAAISGELQSALALAEPYVRSIVEQHYALQDFARCLASGSRAVTADQSGVTTSDVLRSVLANVAEPTARATNTTRAVVYVLEESVGIGSEAAPAGSGPSVQGSRTLVPVASAGFAVDAQLPKVPIPEGLPRGSADPFKFKGRGLEVASFLGERTLLLNSAEEVHNCPEYDGLLETLTEGAPNSVGVTPLRSNSKVVGVLRVEHRKARDGGRHARFSAIDQLVLERLAAMLALAVVNQSDRSQLEQRLEQLCIDQRTGLSTRYAFARAHYPVNCTALFIDLDDFKEYNQLYSYEVANQVLKHVGQILKQTLEAFLAGLADQGQKFEGMACRYGGDEFFIALRPDPTTEGRPPSIAKVGLRLAREVLEGLRVTQTFTDSHQSLRVMLTEVAASIGLASGQDGDDDAGVVIERASRASKVAKHLGKGRVAAWSDLEAIAALSEKRNLTIKEILSPGEVLLSAGSKDGVFKGLPFLVLPSVSPSTDSAFRLVKAELRATAVFQDVSLCRVERPYRVELVAGDVVLLQT